MKDKIKSHFPELHLWQIVLFSVVGAVIITDSVTATFSYLVWHDIQSSLMILGTVNAIVVPLLLLPPIVRRLRKMVLLEEQNKENQETIIQLGELREIDAATQRRADEMALLYQLGVSLTSGKNLYDTLLALQTEIIKLIHADAFYVAIYDEKTDIVTYPIFFDEGGPLQEAGHLLHEWPGLTGAVIFSGKTLYLPDMFEPEAVKTYHPYDINDLVLHTFLGIPLIGDEKVFGMLSVQSSMVNAYTPEQIQLVENIAFLAASSINTTNLLDELKQELTDRKRVEEQLHEREAILEAVTFVAEKFLKASDWRTNMDLALERFGKTLKVTHAYLFEDHLNSQGEPVTSMRYEWTAPGYPSDLGGEYFQESKIDQKGYEEQVEALKRGDVRIGNSSTFNPIEKESMDEFGVKAILEVPVFVNGKEWGAIGFDDFEHERDWSTAEVDALKLAAEVLSAAIQRQEIESAVHESERIYRQAIEAAGAVPYFQDYKVDQYRFIGQGIQKITGYAPEEMTLTLWNNITQEQELVGHLEGLDVDETARRVRNGELSPWRCDVHILTKDGASKWIADSAIELFDENGISYASIGIMQDITDRKQIEASLRQREAILEAATFAAEQFLKSSDWRLNMDNVLKRMGETFDATHVYLFEHSIGADDVEYSMLKYEWTAPGHSSDFDNPQYQIPKPINMDEDSTDHNLRYGRIFSGNSTTFPPAEWERLNSLGVKAMLEVPLFVDGKWWGTFGLDDLVTARDWSLAEVDALKIAAGILAAAIQRQEAESAVRESERIYRQAIEAAGAVPYYQNYKIDQYQFIGQGIQKITGYPPENMGSILWNSFVVNQEMTGDLAGLDADEAGMLVRTGKVDSWTCDYQIRARDGQLKWIADTAIELFDDTGLSYGSIGILQDVTERKLIESNLRKRESILEAVTFAAEQFLRTSDWRINIDAVLERLGKEFNASHAYLFEKHQGMDGTLLNSLRYEWVAPGQRSDLDDPAYQNAPVNDSDFRQYYEILDSGEPFVGNTSFFYESEIETAWMISTGIKALLEMRIVVDGRQWGTIGFDEMTRDRDWTVMEVDALRVAASVLGAAIKRQLDEEAINNELAERRRAEQALLVSEEKFSKAFHNTHVLTTIEDQNHIFIDVNNAFLKAFGLEREDVIGRSMSDLKIVVNPDDIQTLRQTHDKNGHLRDYEMKYRLGSGEIGSILISSEKIYLDNAEFTLTTGLDITERKRAEEKYRSIFDNSIDGIFQSTDDGRFLSVNPAMARIYGYASPEDMLSSINDIQKQLYVNAEERDDVRRRLSSGERLLGYESLDYRKDGSTFWSSMSAQSIYDDDRKLLYYEGTVEDITPRKQAEAEREALIQELANKNTELERFTYTVSHDLKSPLVTINGFIGFLEQDALSGNIERLKKDTRRIQEAVLKMQRLLNELLELSRIGRMMNLPEKVPFNEVVAEAMTIVHGRLEEHGVKVHVQSNLPVVFGDRPRLVEILQNLLDNAAKYMGDQPSPCIEVGQRGEDAERGMPVFFVKDNGIGIEPQHHERVFGLFNKLDARSEGTGVGLALVKRIVEVHRGRIWVESEAGGGSIFLFTLPIEPEA